MGMPGLMPGMMGGPPTPVMLLDAANNKLFIVLGDRLFMYSTTDLKLLAEARLPMPKPDMMGMGGGPRPPQPGVAPVPPPPPPQ